MISAQEALERLREGNRRFVSDIRSGDTSRARRAAPANWRPGRSRSPSFWDVPIRGYPRRSSSIKALAICLSSALPETSSPLLKSAASSSPRSGSAHGWWWCWGTPSAGPFWPPWKNLRVLRKTSRGICVRSSTASGPQWKRCWRQNSSTTRTHWCGRRFGPTSASRQTICDTDRKFWNN